MTMMIPRITTAIPTFEKRLPTIHIPASTDITAILTRCTREAVPFKEDAFARSHAPKHLLPLRIPVDPPLEPHRTPGLRRQFLECQKMVFFYQETPVPQLRPRH